MELSADDAGHQGTKPSLSELYGTGIATDTIDMKDPRFAPLLKGIEEAIVDYVRSHQPAPTGGSILLTVKQLGMNPEQPTADPLGQSIQASMTECLAEKNYSRLNVKGALRVIARSVHMHTDDGGPHEYIRFLSQFI